VGTPEPILPDFAGASLVNVLRALWGSASHGGDGDPAGAGAAWLPDAAAAPTCRVLLVLDGLGWEQLRARAAIAPTLAGAAGTAITSVVPSTTAAALTSLTTGLPPAVHGIVGYRLAVEDRILNVLRWKLDGVDARTMLPAKVVQPHPSFPGAPDGTPPVVTRADYAATGFTAAHLGTAPLHGWQTASGLVVEVRRRLAAGAPFVYAYYDGIDRVAHAYGLGEHYDAELRSVDRMVADLLEVLPPGAILAVTADHGEVDVGATVELLGPEVMEGVVLLSGEGRFRWLHARRGAVDDVLAAAVESFGHLAWVRTRDEVFAEGWLGGEPIPAVADRLGDVVLAPFEPTAFIDPADTGEQRMVGRHGSLTAAEMLVPLLVLHRER
jgi:hypothetical protein